MIRPDLIPLVRLTYQIDGPLGTRLIGLRIDGLPVLRLDYGTLRGVGWIGA